MRAAFGLLVQPAAGESAALLDSIQAKNEQNERLSLEAERPSAY
ncbi:protein of unknown function [Shewanella benthica]|uniref:Uncharacterized protein n=1 Tax=Shewanella benthica TaxID=43661 RepID=A0A330M5E3_9GAMM|nr:protein of unknown function [Shewanella benthica]